MSRGRRVLFEDEIQGAEIRRTRGHSRRRSLSAERVHSIVDDVVSMQGRERVIGREAFDKLQRENQYLRIQLRDAGDAQTHAAQLERENTRLRNRVAELEHENRDRRSSDLASDNEVARKESKLNRLRKKYAKLEVDVSNLVADVASWRKSYEGAERRANDSLRRAGIIRNNMALVEADRDRLAQENDNLRRDLDMERLRRRHY